MTLLQHPNTIGLGVFIHMEGWPCMLLRVRFKDPIQALVRKACSSVNMSQLF